MLLKSNYQDFDGSSIGQAVTTAVLSTNGPKEMMTWSVKNASEFPNGMDDVSYAIGKSKAWAAIAIRNGASSSLANAIATIDSSYNGTAVITAFGNQARNDNA
jgi:hypothetical protein